MGTITRFIPSSLSLSVSTNKGVLAGRLDAIWCAREVGVAQTHQNAGRIDWQAMSDLGWRCRDGGSWIFYLHATMQIHRCAAQLETVRDQGNYLAVDHRMLVWNCTTSDWTNSDSHLRVIVHDNRCLKLFSSRPVCSELPT